MNRFIQSIAGAAMLVTSAAAPAPEKRPTSVKVGSLAPDFELKLIDGTKVTLADNRGQVIVLNFWATWCVPCRQELPLLDAYYDKFRTKGLRVYAITTESSLPLYRLKPLFARMAIPSVKSVKGPYGGGSAVPFNIVIDRTGRVRYAQAGAFDLDRLNALLVPLMNEAAPTS